ncbi:thymopoietin a isoform X2 [Conger conger]|uniref:thymopoietin a isoform X2 n=1 Tax=Conger conger TaxID=82655 RepID=UPI002A59AE8C|nr:thymopoietin a isoform X2 [Conger conger]
MSEFLEDPSILTKDKLKSELVANNVSLPSGEHKKDVYVQLYLKTLTVRNKKKSPPDAFSSDEELPPPVVSNKSRSGRKATRKTDKPPADEVDAADLSDESLRDQLLKYGVSIGPIVASTRKLYERKLQKLMEQGPPEPAPPPAAPTKIDSNQNGNTDSDQYSDKEEEVRAVPEPEPEPQPEPVPVVEKPARSRGKTPPRTRRQDHNREDDEEEEEQVEDHLVLNVKRRSRRSSLRLDQRVPASNDGDVSEGQAPRPVTPTPQGKGSKLPRRQSVVGSCAESSSGKSTKCVPLSSYPGLLQEPKSLLVNKSSEPSPLSKFEGLGLPSPSPRFAHVPSTRGILEQPSLHQPALVESLSPVISQVELTSLSPPQRQVVCELFDAVELLATGVEGVLQEPNGLLVNKSSEPSPLSKFEGVGLRFAHVPSTRGILEQPSLNQPTPVESLSPIISQAQADPIFILKGLLQQPKSSEPSPLSKFEGLGLRSPSPRFAHVPLTRGILEQPSLNQPTPVESLSPIISQVVLTSLSPPQRQGVLQEPKILLVNKSSEPSSLSKFDAVGLRSPSPHFAHVPSTIQEQPSLHQPTQEEWVSEWSRSDTSIMQKLQRIVPLPVAVTPVRGQVEERLAARDPVSVVGEKDLLKEMFPNQPSTPTGISATCRRPIRGAAGRPLTASDFRLDDTWRRSKHIETSTSYVENRSTVRAAAPLLSSSSSSSSSFSSSSVAAPSVGVARPRRSLPVWLQLLLLSGVAGFLFFVYQAMETNKINPFGGPKDLEGAGQ